MSLSKTEKGRYSRQIILDEIGEEGQEKLMKSSAIIVGCGALGSVIANNLARSGIGNIQIVDRDLVEVNNLQRQTLFDENDIDRPKAIVGAEKLAMVNSDITIKAVVEDLNHTNIEKIIETCDVVIDGTDNMETRFLLNDACVKNGIPWIYGGAIETQGMSMNIIPGKTPCLRCIVSDLPGAGSLPTCDTVGVLNTIPAVIASIECTEALKILLGKPASKELLIYDIWKHEFQAIKVKKNDKCECCANHNFEFLNGEKKELLTSLCGSNAIQITPYRKEGLPFEKLAQNLRKVGSVHVTEFLIKFEAGQHKLIIFRNGRTIIYGTTDEKIARSLYAKYIGA